MIHMRLTVPLRWMDRERQCDLCRIGNGSRIGAVGAGAGGEAERPGRQWKLEAKAGSSAGSTVDFNFSAVRGTDRTHDRQAETGAAIFTRTRRIGAIETIEYMRQSGARDADAAVAY